MVATFMHAEEALQLSLSPGAARLAQAIEGLDQAQQRLENAQKPISKLEQIRSAAVMQEAPSFALKPLGSEQRIIAKSPTG